jgi:V/A-type H+-transporting ATPase subunit I
MITKMEKYSFILFHTDLAPFLEKVQSLGMVDITRENRAVDEKSKEYFGINSRYQRIIKRINAHYESTSEEVRNEMFKSDKFTTLNESELLNIAEEAISSREQLLQEADSLKREYDESTLWGAFHKEDVAKIEQLGYKIHLFSVSEKKFNPDWEKSYILQVLNSVNGRVLFAILTNKEEDLRFEIAESKQPQRSCDTLEKRIFEIAEEIKSNSKTILDLYFEISRMERERERVMNELDLYLAGQSSVREAEGSIVLLSGFAPVENRESVTKLLDGEGVYYITEDAVKEDNPPVKLKNSFFASLYEPIGDLYMLPKYGELDLTPYFAPFYMLFFGLCLGDMGYGLILLLGATLAKFKFPKFKGYLTLVQFLGFGAILMGALPGVFFGTSLKEIIPMHDSVKELFFSDLKMFWFAIVFGLFQIVFARMLNAIYSIINRGWQYGMSNIGWTLLIVWASFKYASTMSETIVVPQILNWLAIAGAFLILGFSSDSKNPLKRFFGGVVSFWDVTSLFGDMLSYIRLFGLGTAGAILGMVVNSVAMSLSGIQYVGWFFAGLMLLVGHLMVLMLSSLGAFVHPMRLTFVEFYKNASFSGGGRPFRPLGKDMKLS